MNTEHPFSEISYSEKEILAVEDVNENILGMLGVRLMRYEV